MGSLPDRIREIAILRYAARNRLDYERAHHLRPAKLAGVPPATIAALAESAPPDELGVVECATMPAVDQIMAGAEIAEPIQRVRTRAGAAGELAVTRLRRPRNR
jgi:alkylhydroperoxidase family enzyme